MQSILILKIIILANFMAMMMILQKICKFISFLCAQHFWMYVYHRELECSSTKASLYPIMFGCLIDARILTSFNAFSFSLSVRFMSLTFFRAYSLSSHTLLILYTLLYAPSPSLLTTVNSFRDIDQVQQNWRVNWMERWL